MPLKMPCPHNVTSKREAQKYEAVCKVWFALKGNEDAVGAVLFISLCFPGKEMLTNKQARRDK